MNRSDMIALVERLAAADGTEEELDGILDQLVNSAPNSMISDLIYYPDAERDPEQIVDEALRREEEHAAGTPLAQEASA